MGRLNTFLKRWTSITRLSLIGIGYFATGTLQAREIKILAFGDSLTAGYKLPANEAYPAQLQNLLAREGYTVAITNAGVSGDTSEQGLRRVDWAMRQGPYDLVLLCLGANDGLRQMAISKLEANLEKMIEKFQAKKAKVILIGMQLPSNFNRRYRENFESAFVRVAQKKKVELLPFLLNEVAADPELNLDDQIHPNAKGYSVIAKNVMRFLLPKLAAYKTPQKPAPSRDG